MSDLQDLIATNAVRAYNEGFERGATEERDRIIKLLEEYSDGELLIIPTGQILELIEGEQE